MYIIKTRLGYIESIDPTTSEPVIVDLETQAELFSHPEEAMHYLGGISDEGIKANAEIIHYPCSLDEIDRDIIHATKLKDALGELPAPFVISTDTEHTPDTIDDAFPDDNALLFIPMELFYGDTREDFHKTIPKGATFADFYRAVAEGMAHTGDEHHQFLESWKVEEGIITVSLGS